jgi:1-acyl-sn-glycerol-3-phosphate acyltransferase
VRDVYRPWLYRFLRGVVRLGLHLFWRVRVEGLEKVPQTGSVLLCSNHISAIDPPAVGAVMRREVHFMAKIELFSYLGWLLPRIGAFPVNRDVRDSRAVRQTLRLAQRGEVIGLFPEGHRQPPGVLGQPRPGAGSLIGHVKAAVVPVAVRGPWRLFRRVEIRFGAPIDLRNSQDPAQDVMRAIARLYYEPEQFGQGLPWAESD